MKDSDGNYYELKTDAWGTVFECIASRTAITIVRLFLLKSGETSTDQTPIRNVIAPEFFAACAC